MTVYSIKIPFKSESDTARLRAVIEADLAACETIEVRATARILSAIMFGKRSGRPTLFL